MAATQTMSGSVGWTMMRPMCMERFRPMFFQLLPPSRERYTPSP